MSRLLLLSTLAFFGAAFLTLPAARAADAKPAKADTKPAKADAKPAKAAPADKTADKAAGKPAEKGAPPPASSSPMAELKKSNEKLDKILQKNRPNWSPEAELQREEVRKLVGSFLDYGELAHRSLARHWDTITAK